MGIWIRTKKALMVVNKIIIVKQIKIINRNEMAIYILVDDRMNEIAKYDSEERAIAALNYIKESILKGAIVIEINDE